MKFLHISIKLLILDYNYKDYINFSSIFKKKNINTSYNDFTESLT